MDLWALLLLAAIGCVAGFLNVVAGGGSLLTMPVMIFLGMSPAMANGTNRVALIAQNVTAIGTFRRRGFSNFRQSLTLGLCTLPGAVIGAFAAIHIDPLWFKRLLALVMVGVLLSIFMTKRKKDKDEENDEEEQRDPTSKGRLIAAHLGMVLVGFYGGFIQAGVGFILMAILHRFLQLDLVRVNMHKVFVVAVYMLPSLVVFALLEQVDWASGALLALGNAFGGWLGTRVQLSRGEGIVRVVFAIAVVGMVVRLIIE